jgi:hypothetical protein
MIIGISGYKQTGKDTIGKIIQYLTSDKDRHGRTLDDFFKDLSENDLTTYDGCDWEIKKMASKIKKILSVLTGISVEDMEKDEVKKSFLNREWDRVDEYGNRHRVTVRQALQELGTELFRKEFHENTWLNALFADYKPIGMTDGWRPTYNDPDNSGLHPTAEPIYPNWVITDIRYPNEADRVLHHGGILIKVNVFKTSEEWIKVINKKKEIFKYLRS